MNSRLGRPPCGPNRVNRGGSWNNNSNNCRSANRNNNDPGNTNNNIGFRVVLAPALAPARQMSHDENRGPIQVARSAAEESAEPPGPVGTWMRRRASRWPLPDTGAIAPLAPWNERGLLPPRIHASRKVDFGLPEGTVGLGQPRGRMRTGGERLCPKLLEFERTTL